ncbi:MAG: Holliday junction branch migration protein RuvA [Candidatus Cloacimonetes bacterium]|nr:Holliday junction branch migration protein RuvA [Candidatus Cloacimonadota bacterium]
MISYIKGKLLLREPSRVIVSTGNLGYSISLDQKTELTLGGVGTEVELYTYQVVRETELSLYGFDSLMKLELFELLLKANKVGPKVAISFLSSLSPQDILKCIESGDPKSFGKVSGAGPKLMMRVILDCQAKGKRLMEKYGIFTTEDSAQLESGEIVNSGNYDGEIIKDALITLGFTSSEIKDSLKEVGKKRGANSFNSESMISECLKYFYSKKL